MEAFMTSSFQPNTQVQKLLHRAWWHRVWVIQEVTLAKAVLLLCGTRLFSWEKVIAAILYFKDYRYEYQKKFPLPNSTGFHAPVEHFLVFWDLMQQEQHAAREQHTEEHLALPNNELQEKSQNIGLSLEQGLGFLMRLDGDAFQASDDRDRVYAFLAFFSESSRALISVDYSKENTFSDVSNGITGRMLQKYGPRILAYCHNSFEPRINSSWYIDWTRIRTEFAIFDPMYEAESAAAGYETYYPEVLEVGKKLLVPMKGKKVSKIELLAKFDVSCSPASGEAQHQDKFKSCLQMMEELLEPCPNGPKKSHSLDNLWVVPIAGTQQSRYSSVSSHLGWPPKPFEAQLERRKDRAMIDNRPYPFGIWPEYARSVKGLGGARLKDFGDWRVLRNLKHSFLNLFHAEDFYGGDKTAKTTFTWPYESRLKLNGNKGFVTSDSMAGLGPKSIQEDDLIVIFKGCEFPFVIRPHCEERKEYELVGACYVDGIMYGEAMEENPTFEDMFLV